MEVFDGFEWAVNNGLKLYAMLVCLVLVIQIAIGIFEKKESE